MLATGSSMVAPLTAAVGAILAEAGARPVEVRSVGTLAGYGEFCQGGSLRHPDIQDASRRMTMAELMLCARHGVHEIMEIPIGYDGIVLAHRRGLPSPSITLQQLWLGLAKEVPQNGRLVPNPCTRWRQVSSSLPDWPIRVIGPPPSFGTRNSFVEMAMSAGCQAVPEMRAIADTARRRSICSTMREDEGWTDAGENDDTVVRLILEGEPGVLGVFGYGTLQANTQWIEGLAIEGVQDEPETIANGRYPFARPLFFYVKRPNLEQLPGLKAFLAEYLSDRAMGPEGYLVQLGLVPLEPARPEQVRKAVRDQAIILRRPGE